MVVIAVMFTPVHIYINTDLNTYRISQAWWMAVEFKYDEEEILLMDFRLVGIRFKPISIIDRIFFSKKAKKKKTSKYKSIGKNIKIEKLLKVLRALEVREFYLNIDTGDPVRNAKLYPLFELLNFRFGGFRVNFLGYNRLIMDVQGRPIKFLKIFVEQ